jgi:putative IMPACT (imprinted ancient) family translation regulator
MASTGAIHRLQSYDSEEEEIEIDEDNDEDDELEVEDAIQRLTQSLRGAEYAIPITHGTPFVWRRCKFQAHASPAQFPRDVQYVIDKLREESPWSKGRYNPCAYRLTSGDPMIQRIDVDGTPQGTPATTGSENGSGSGSFSSSTGLLEGCGDGGDPGAGDKLLDLLRKWDIQNVVLCVTNWDDGLRGRLGSGRYRLYLNSAKDVLEKCYLDSVSTAASTEATDDDDQGRSTHSSILSGSSKNSSDMDSRASDFDSNKSSSVVRIPSPGRLSGGIASRADLDNIVEMGRTKMPRGIDLHRMYRRARARFMPVREEYQHIKKSFVDADSANFPTGVR